MYLDYYGLTEPPFDITPNPRFLFYRAKHREASFDCIARRGGQEAMAIARSRRSGFHQQEEKAFERFGDVPDEAINAAPGGASRR